MKKIIRDLVIDIILCHLALLLASYLKMDQPIENFQLYYRPFLVFVLFHVFFSLLNRKYGNGRRYSYLQSAYKYAQALFMSFSVSIIIIYYFQLEGYSRFIVLGTVFAIGLLELFWISVYYAFVESVDIIEKEDLREKKVTLQQEILVGKVEDRPDKEEFSRSIKTIITEESGTEVYNFLNSYSDLLDQRTIILATTTRFNILKLPEYYYSTIINLKRINDIQYINKFFEGINSRLQTDGCFVGCVETYSIRKTRILSKYPAGLNYFIYSLDFLFKRVSPKMPLTKKIYFWITKGSNRVLSKAETFGRLYSCGFILVEECQIGNLLWFKAIKKKEPVFDTEPTYGPLIKLRRFGKDGKIIKVYKMRTMHAYSEYLQEYIYQRNLLQEGGKFKDDFRITTLGTIMRKLWIDELPMLTNVFKGELKIVGVRPLSRHYYNLYTDELKQKRILYKPGLIPPFYADMPKTLEEIMESEMRYLNSYEKNPFRTDWKYFWKAINNILIKNARSA